MSKDWIAATVKDGVIVEYDKKYLPLYLQKTKDFESWLKGRAIDSHRTNSRLLKKALRISSADDIDTALKVNAATITDTYWFKKDDSNLSYEDVRFKKNLFDKLALYGDPDSFNNDYSRTPELTNIGSFEKCWRLIDEKWWMYKGGNEKEYFSELFIYQFGKALGFNMAVYEMDGQYIRSADFTDGASMNFEAAAGIVLDEEDYSVNFRALKEQSFRCAEEYVKMTYLDALCFNMDRHTMNYGVLREPETGKVVSMAPLFDHNISLIARGYPKNVRREKDKLIDLFTEFLGKEDAAMQIFQSMKLPEINQKLIHTCCQAVPIGVDAEYIGRFILNGERQIREKVAPTREK